MHIVIKKFRSNSVDESIKNAQMQFLPLVSKMAGFVDYHVVKAGPDMIVSILQFTSEAEAAASTAMSLAWVNTNGFDSLYQLQELISGDVVVHS